MILFHFIINLLLYGHVMTEVVSKSRMIEDVSQVSANNTTENISNNKKSRFYNILEGMRKNKAPVALGLVAGVSLMVYGAMLLNINRNIALANEEMRKSCHSLKSLMNSQDYTDCLERAERASNYCFSENEACVIVKNAFHLRNFEIVMSKVRETLKSWDDGNLFKMLYSK